MSTSTAVISIYVQMYNSLWFNPSIWRLWPLSTIFQLYRGSQFYWWS